MNKTVFTPLTTATALGILVHNLRVESQENQENVVIYITVENAFTGTQTTSTDEPLNTVIARMTRAFKRDKAISCARVRDGNGVVVARIARDSSNQPLVTRRQAA